MRQIGGSSYLAGPHEPGDDRLARAALRGHRERKKVLRDLIKASAEITEDAFGSAQGQELEDLMDNIEQKILSISQKSVPQNFIPVKDELKGAYERMAKLHGRRRQTAGRPDRFCRA